MQATIELAGCNLTWDERKYFECCK